MKSEKKTEPYRWQTRSSSPWPITVVEQAKRIKLEVSPPDRKEQVKGIKKHMAQKKGKDKIPKTYVDKKTGKRKETNPWALAWAQYDKYGVPSRIEKD